MTRPEYTSDIPSRVVELKGFSDLAALNMSGQVIWLYVIRSG